MLNSRLGAIVLACVLALAAIVPAQAAKGKDDAPKLAAEGATPNPGEITLDHTFKNLVNGDGRMSMKELRGSVVLIDWWGYH
jgi:hypothetical protein